jgi:ribosomal protein S27AE
VCYLGVMTMVLRPGEALDNLVAAGNASCPRCAGPLRRWGQARWRVVRDAGAGDHRFRPKRVRCGDCGITQVVLPADVLVRRRDPVQVVGEAWRSFAAGAGSRQVARQIGLPTGTVRGWLRRLRLLADRRYTRSGGSARDHLRWTLAFVEAEAGRAGCLEGDLWGFVAYRSQGRLLCNTNWP